MSGRKIGCQQSAPCVILWAMLNGLVFDFDGVIIDTETPLFTAWEQTYLHFDAEPITTTEWAHSLGRRDDDPLILNPLARLQNLLDRPVDLDHIQAMRRRLRDEMLNDLPVQPGVIALVDQADQLDIPVAIASSSPPDWIERHLQSRRLVDRFPIVCCAGDGVPGKPHPAVYLQAAAALGVPAGQCLAIEDSPHGTTAAKSAGMSCVAVPTAVSWELDFSHADRVIDTLEELALPNWHPSPA